MKFIGIFILTTIAFSLHTMERETSEHDSKKSTGYISKLKSQFTNNEFDSQVAQEIQSLSQSDLEQLINDSDKTFALACVIIFSDKKLDKTMELDFYNKMYNLIENGADIFLENKLNNVRFSNILSKPVRVKTLYTHLAYIIKHGLTEKLKNFIITVPADYIQSPKQKKLLTDMFSITDQFSNTLLHQAALYPEINTRFIMIDLLTHYNPESVNEMKNKKNDKGLTPLDIQPSFLPDLVDIE